MSASSSPARSTPWYRDLRFWLGLTVSVAGLWLTFRNVNGRELLHSVRAVDWGLLGLAMLVALFDQIVRGLRWRVLLQPVGRVSSADAFSYLSIGALANALLPLRAGEVIRATLLGEKRALSKSALFATVVVERIFDVLALALLALLLLAVMPIPREIKQAALLLGGVSAAALLALWLLSWLAARGRGGRAATWLGQAETRVLHPAQDHRLLGVNLTQVLRRLWQMAHSFFGGLRAVQSPRLLWSVGWYTVLAWLASLGYIWLVLRACHLDLPWSASLMVLVFINLGAALPSTPGGVGLVHWLAREALLPWQVADQPSATFALMVHAAVYLVMVGVGLLCLWREGVQFRQLTRSDPATSETV